MSEPTSPEPAKEPTHDTPSMAFANDPAFRDKVGTAILELIDLAKIKLTTDNSTNRGTMRDAFLMALALALVIIVPVSLLTYYGKMSTDAATFVFGALTGAAFAFARDFIPPGPE